MWRLKVRVGNKPPRLYSSFGPTTKLSELKAAIINDFELISSADDLDLTSGHPPVKLGTSGSLEQCGLSDAQLIIASIRNVDVIRGKQDTSLAKKKAGSSSSKTKKKIKKGSSSSDSGGEHEVELEDDSEDEAARLAKRAPRPKDTARSPGISRTSPSTSSTQSLRPFQNRIVTLRQHQPKKKLRSREEVEEALAQSAVKNGSRDTISKMFRRLTRGEVVKQYEVSDANAKLVAALTGKFEIQAASTASSYRLSDGVPMEYTLTIKYQKGARSWRTETVQGLGEELLRETVRSVLRSQSAPDDLLSHPREGLRPIALPLMSPRVFWSLVHLKGGGQNCVERALNALLPSEDWSFLDSRIRKETERVVQWRKTESILDALERGVQGASAASLQEQADEEDEFTDFVESKEVRDSLRNAGINTLLGLANCEPGFVSGLAEASIDDARHAAIPELTDEILMGVDPTVRARLEQLDIKTPSDIARLRIPGRTEMVQEETKVERQIIDDWKAHAEAKIHEFPWLSVFRTRG